MYQTSLSRSDGKVKEDCEDRGEAAQLFVRLIPEGRKFKSDPRKYLT